MRTIKEWKQRIKAAVYYRPYTLQKRVAGRIILEKRVEDQEDVIQAIRNEAFDTAIKVMKLQIPDDYFVAQSMAFAGRRCALEDAIKAIEELKEKG